MSEPVVDRILANVRTRMAAYTSAFRSTKVATWQPKDLVIHVEQGEMTPRPELGFPGNPPAQAYEVAVIISGITKPSDDDTTPIDQLRNRLSAEIIKAATNAARWHTWGELAIDTQLGNIEPHVSEDGGMPAVKVNMAITFRTDEDDPYQVRA